jgi:hypothetical protein
MMAINKMIDWLKEKGNKAEAWKNTSRLELLSLRQFNSIDKSKAYIDITKLSMSCNYSSHFSNCLQK